APSSDDPWRASCATGCPHPCPGGKTRPDPAHLAQDRGFRTRSRPPRAASLGLRGSPRSLSVSCPRKGQCPPKTIFLHWGYGRKAQAVQTSLAYPWLSTGILDQGPASARSRTAQHPISPCPPWGG